MDSLALSNDYTTLLKEAERLRADLSSKIIERDMMCGLSMSENRNTI